MTKYLDICNRLRTTEDGENFFLKMVQTEKEITEEEFVNNVNITELPVLDHDETWNQYKEYAGEDLKYYEADNAFFCRVAGFEFIWEK